MSLVARVCSRSLTPLLLAGLLAAGVMTTAGCSSEEEAARDRTPVVATYGDSTVRLAEFERRYLETVPSRAAARADSLSGYTSFLDRRLDFLVRAYEARERGWHEEPEFRRRLAAYRGELAREYAVSDSLRRLARMIHDRRRYEVEVAQVYVPVPPPRDEDALAEARRRAETIRDSARAGTPFVELARRHSEGPFDGMMGYIRQGENPVPFEKWAYRLEPGELSPIFQTHYGFHVLKVLDRRRVDTTRLPTYDRVLANLQRQAREMPDLDGKIRRARVAQIRARGVRIDTTLLAELARQITQPSDWRRLATSASDPSGATQDGSGSAVAAQEIARLGDSTYSVAQLAPALADGEATTLGAALEVADRWIDELAFQQWGAELARTDPSFRREVREYERSLLVNRMLRETTAGSRLSSELSSAPSAPGAVRPAEDRSRDAPPGSDLGASTSTTRLDSLRKALSVTIYEDRLRQAFTDSAAAP